jgi:hypothetical protein
MIEAQMLIIDVTILYDYISFLLQYVFCFISAGAPNNEEVLPDGATNSSQNRCR